MISSVDKTTYYILYILEDQINAIDPSKLTIFMTATKRGGRSEPSDLSSVEF